MQKWDNSKSHLHKMGITLEFSRYADSLFIVNNYTNNMKSTQLYRIFTVCALLFTGASQAETYQATGPVTEVTDSKIVITKGKENWEILRNASTKLTGTPKVGDKVTVTYSMTAESIEVKGAKADKEEKKAEKEKAKAEKEKKAPAEPKKAA